MSSEMEEIVAEVAKSGEIRLIFCTNASEQESKRVQAFHAKNKIGYLAKNIGITKLSKDDNLFVKVSKRDPLITYTMNKETGEITKDEYLKDEAERLIKYMIEDGLSIEEILANLPDESEALVRAAFDRLK